MSLKASSLNSHFLHNARNDVRSKSPYNYVGDVSNGGDLLIELYSHFRSMEFITGKIFYPWFYSPKPIGLC